MADITLTDDQASAVEISTVDGDVSYSGALLADRPLSVHDARR